MGAYHISPPAHHTFGFSLFLSNKSLVFSLLLSLSYRVFFLPRTCAVSASLFLCFLLLAHTFFVGLLSPL